ncbi:MAG TPA: hypothetical protein VGB89_13830 [Bacteroidota bacterium]
MTKRKIDSLNTVAPVLLLFVCVVGLTVGCNNDSTSPVGTEAGSPFAELSKIGDTTGCMTSSGFAIPTLNVQLFSGASGLSYAKFKAGSVLALTPASFSVCSLDTTSSSFATKGTSLSLGLLPVSLVPVDVQLEYVDAGFPSNTSSGTYFDVFRLNQGTGVWEFVLVDRTAGGKVRYSVSTMGTYALRLLQSVIDTTWRAQGLITSLGGTINLLGASLVIPAGALLDTTMITFDLTETMPIGLPGATRRVYDFGPEGSIFQVPITFYVPFDDAGITGEKVPNLRLYWFDPATNSWVRQPTESDWTNRRFVATLSHFSRYAFGR